MDWNVELFLIIDLIENDEQRNQLNFRRRTLRDISDPFNLPETTFQNTYRLSRALAHFVLLEISPHLRVAQRPETALPNVHKLLTCLHFLGHGSYQKSVSQDFNFAMSQSSVSRAVGEICNAIITHFGHIIQFPVTEQEQSRIKENFLDIGGFPGIIGAIDCTQIAIQAPKYNDDIMPGIVFLNRKGYYSVNTQIIVDAKLKILGICARFPGSVHDSAIWTQSTVKANLENGFHQGNTNSWLIGDSGYPLQPFLMTPIGGNNLNPQEIEFNRRHKTARNVIERLNGVLKARFRCCLGHRTLHYKPIMAAKIIYTCGILHNLMLNRGELDFEDYDDELPAEDRPDIDDHDIIGHNWLNEGRRVRQRIVNLLI